MSDDDMYETIFMFRKKFLQVSLYKKSDMENVREKYRSMLRIMYDYGYKLLSIMEFQSDVMHGGNYYEKYVMYKNKYMTLKNKNKNK